MAAGIFYKEIEDPTDPSKKIPVPLSDLLGAKIDVAVLVPKNKEVGILELGRDISNNFQLADDKTKPAISLVTPEEKTHILVATKDKDFTARLSIKDVNKTADRIQTFTGGRINENVTVNVPAKYRNKVVFYKCVAQYGSLICWVSGGLIPANTSTFTVKSPVLEGHEWLTVQLHVDIHEVTLGPSAPEGYADLSEIFTGKGEDLSKWWSTLLYLSGNEAEINYFDDDDWYTFTKTIQNLPRGELKYRVIGGRWYHSDFFEILYVNDVIKEKGAAGVSFTWSSPGYAWVFGLTPLF